MSLQLMETPASQFTRGNNVIMTTKLISLTFKHLKLHTKRAENNNNMGGKEEKKKLEQLELKIKQVHLKASSQHSSGY